MVALSLHPLLRGTHQLAYGFSLIVTGETQTTLVWRVDAPATPGTAPVLAVDVDGITLRFPMSMSVEQIMAHIADVPGLNADGA